MYGNCSCFVLYGIKAEGYGDLATFSESQRKLIVEGENDDMVRYCIREIQEQDYKKVVEIYNSNPSFLLHHLGMEFVDEGFVIDEVASMKKMGFCSCVIVDDTSNTIQGILDFKHGTECYLSLLMLAKECQRSEKGREIYTFFESLMREKGSLSIRIDVVNDYQDNVVPFWLKLGFDEVKTEQLTWGNKTSLAVIMRKNIQS